MMSAYVSCGKETEKIVTLGIAIFVTAIQSCSSSPNPRTQFVCYHNHNIMEIMINNVVLLFFATNKQAGNWSRNAFRDCLWDRYRRCACQISANFPPVPVVAFGRLQNSKKTLNIYNCSKWPLLFYRTHLKKNQLKWPGTKESLLSFLSSRYN